MALSLGVTGVVAIVAAIAIVTPPALGPQLESTSDIADLRTTPAITVEPGANPSDTIGTAPTGPEPAAGRSAAGPDPDPDKTDTTADTAADNTADTAGTRADPGTAPPTGTNSAGTPSAPTETAVTASPDPVADGSRPPATSAPIPAPLATPLAAGGLGVVVSSVVDQLMSIGEQIGNQLVSPDWDLPFEIDIRLADGTTGRAEVIDPGDQDAPALVRLPTEMAVDGYSPAIAEPEPDDLVTVLADTPIVVRYVELVDLDPSQIRRGTAVIDQRGRLLGLCEHDTTDSSLTIRILMISEIGWPVSETRPRD